jgi:hypothetical protein
VSGSAFLRMLFLCGAILTMELAMYFCFFLRLGRRSPWPRHDASAQAKSSRPASRNRYKCYGLSDRLCS